MYSATRQIIVNGLSVEINLSTVQDLEGMSLIATFTSPLTGKSYALFEKMLNGGRAVDEVDSVIEESMDSICLRACRALFEREAIVTHVLYKDYLLSRTQEESAAADSEGNAVNVTDEDAKRLDEAIIAFLDCIEKHRKFHEYLKRSGQA